MKNTRGIVGIGLFVTGIGMMFFEQTKSASWLVVGFGVGMIGSSF